MLVKPLRSTRDPMTSYKDIRAETGLALSTISKHFNGLPIRPENRAAIDGRDPAAAPAAHGGVLLEP